MNNFNDSLQPNDNHFGQFTEIDYPTQDKEVPDDSPNSQNAELSDEVVQARYLEPYERAALAILNRKSKHAREVIYDNEFTKMSLQDMIVQWKTHMVSVLRETLESIDANTFSASRFWSIIHKEDRLLYMGLTLVMLSVILYVFNIEVV